MLLNCIRAEHMKLKRSYIWLAFALIPVLPALMGTGNYSQNAELLTEGWYSLWTQHTLFYSNFFYAPLIAVYCAYLWRVENFNCNRNRLMTSPVPVYCIILAKYCNVLWVTALTQLWVGALFLLCGKAVGLPGLPPLTILIWLARGIAGGGTVAALLLLFAMLIRSFAVPVAVGVAGGITGLLVSNWGAAMYYPFSLMMMGMNSNREENVLAGKGTAFLVVSVVYAALFLAAASLLLKKRDVRS